MKIKVSETIYLILKLILLILGIIVLAFVRIYPHLDKFKDEIIFKDPDSCYHARRIVYIATHNLKLPFYDPLMSHPYGEIPIWSPLYDWVNATISYLISLGKPSETFILKTSASLTILYGFIELFLIAILIYKATSSMMASILSFIFTGISYPQVKFTNIEIIDHNCFVAVIFCLLLYIHYLFFSNLNRNFKHIALMSLLMSLLFWAWSGSYIFIISLIIIQLLYIAISKQLQLFKTLSISFFISSLFILPLALIHIHLGKKKLSFEHVSLFTVLFMLSASAGYVFFYFVIRALKDNKKLSSIFILIILFAVMVIIVFYSFPLIMEGFKFTSAEDAWVSTIAESKPLFYLQRGEVKEFTFSKAIDKFGYFIFIFPIAFIMILFNRIKLSKELYSILIGSALLFGFLAWKQQKFAFEFSIPYGIIISIFIIWIYKRVTPEQSIIMALLVVMVSIYALKPLGNLFKEKYTPFLGYYSSFKWLKEELNLIGTEINEGHMQESGVIAPRDIGHHLKFYSEAPVITDNFGINLVHKEGLFDMARFFLSENENEAIRIMKQYKCNYVVVPFSSIYEQYPPLINLPADIYFEFKIIEVNRNKKIASLPRTKFYETVGFKLSDIYGSANPYHDETMFSFVALKHFRLMHESSASKSAGKEIPTGALKIYKYVKGKKLIIPEPNDSFYKVEAVIVSNTGNNFFYRQYGYIGSKVIVPYPTVSYKDYPYAISYKVYTRNNIYQFGDITELDIQ